MKMLKGGGLKFFMCVFGGLWKIGEVQGEGVKSGYRTKALFMSWVGTLVKRNKNQLCDYMTTEPARLAGIPVL